ncbi:MAG: alkaline phosphatase, partial [Nocardioidaceae bacterium]
MPHSPLTSPLRSSSSSTGPSRRQVLLAGAAALGSTALGSAHAHAAVPRSPGDVSGVFTLGVASGDPLPDG